MDDNGGKKRVRIALESAANGEQVARTFEGDWYCRNRTVYVRYVEEDEESRIRTLLSWKDGRLKLTRRGSAESEQTFVVGERQPGYYATDQVRLAFDTETTLLREADDPDAPTPEPLLPLQLEWHYSLWSAGEKTGDFVIRLRADESEAADGHPSDTEEDQGGFDS